MTVTLSLNPEVERGLQVRAEKRGLSISELLQEIAERESGSSASPLSSGDDKAAGFIAWADSFPDSPLLSDEAVSRESMYPDRW